MGAIASDGVRVLNDDVVAMYGLPKAVIDAVVREESAELERRECAYRDGRTPVPLWGRTVVLIDDGLATGSTMKALVEARDWRHLSSRVRASESLLPGTAAGAVRRGGSTSTRPRRSRRWSAGRMTK
jgi:putative phosphoribosyl transferase